MPGIISNVTISPPLESIPMLPLPGNLDLAATHNAR
jgi:hypothetical protein